MGTYPGGKNGAGVYHTIINLMPPHSVYVEPFAGSAAIYHHKKPAAKSILIDLDPLPLQQIPLTRGLTVICDDGIHWLVEHARSLPRDALMYCDPPYLLSTRKSGALYNYEMSDEQHETLLDILNEAACRVMISGYWSVLYREKLTAPRWHRTWYMAMTRSGHLAQEWLWMNYELPTELHDHHLVGRNFRERERIKRKVQRWTKRLETMNALDRTTLLAALAEIAAIPDEARSR